MPDLVVIVGPIAAGKTTIASELAKRYRASGRKATALDVDDLVETIGGFGHIDVAGFVEAQAVFSELIRSWMQRGYDVIANGPFFDRAENERLLHAVPSGVVPMRVHLLAPYEATLARVRADPARVLSADAGFLERAYARFQSLLAEMPDPDWSFDTTTTSVEEVVLTMAETLLGPSA